MAELRPTIWTGPDRDTETVARLARELEIQPLTAQLLINRGFTDPAQADEFLRPDLARLHDPFLLPDMDRSAERIKQAIAAGETIAIHGDYDVDGVTSTALYVRTLTALNAKLLYRVPHRKNDGYDLKTRAVEWAHANGAGLIITSDCGIQAHEAVTLANSLGMTVIVTDHHEPGETLPPAYAVVNPHRRDSTYPFPNLAGVGVAFKTMQAVVRLVKPEIEAAYIQKFLDLVACGTVADVMPLLGENRIFASFGLVALAQTKKIGLRALLEGSRIDLAKPLSAEAVGFGIGPRINAVGRMDDASLALDLLLTNDHSEAVRLVETLNNFNFERQLTQKRIFEEALERVATMDLETAKVLIIASTGWNSGVVGIVAGKLVERFYRPAIVISLDDDQLFGKGSARSIPSFDLFAAINGRKHLLLSCGGHELAAGLSLSTENLEAFEREMNIHAEGVLTDDDLTPRFLHDGVIEPQDISIELLDEWVKLAPFGMGNPEPRFASNNLLVNELRRIGKDFSHLKMRIGTTPWETIDCVGWGQGHWTDIVSPGDYLEGLYVPQINEWNGRRTVQFNIKELRRV